MRQKLVLAAVAILFAVSGLSAQTINEKLQQATKDAAKKAAPSVVQITTLGGTDMVVTSPKGPVFRKSLGPTTGVIVGADGYVISSAFNFINNPSNILVGVPGIAEPFVATKVATDRSRMLTLLKIDAKGLPLPVYVPRKDIEVGQWALALGRSLDAKRDNPPAVSLGIISALGRIWGKAVQVDAKVSPINYGGPVVDIRGRVQGILVPASPNAEGETAGYEWYDSGIGFAIPMEDVMAVLPRLKEGKDLNKGLLGVSMKSPDKYSAAPVVDKVTKDSAAARAGIKPGDIIVEVEKQPIVRMAQILHELGTKYEGDKISLEYKRGDKVIEVKDLELVGATTIFAHSFLGILPMRDDPKLGVDVRFVYPDSPAAKAGLKEGDRIVKIGGGERPLSGFTGQVRGKNELSNFLNTITPGTEIEMEVLRKGKPQTLKATLTILPGTLPAKEDVLPLKVPELASAKKFLEPLEVANAKPAKVDAKELPKPETGILKRANPNGTYYVCVPNTYDPNVAHAAVVWFHPPGKNTEKHFKDMFEDDWEDFCEKHNILLVCPVSDNEDGWTPGQADFVAQTINETAGIYSVDRQRIVTHGVAIGGQMAIHMGFKHRDLIRGVATYGSVVTTVKDNLPAQRLSFFISGGTLDPVIKSVAESRVKLTAKRYPVLYRELEGRGREGLTEAGMRDLVRWIDCLDCQ